jgi:hypothetical protein
LWILSRCQDSVQMPQHNINSSDRKNNDNDQICSNMFNSQTAAQAQMCFGLLPPAGSRQRLVAPSRLNTLSKSFKTFTFHPLKFVWVILVFGNFGSSKSLCKRDTLGLARSVTYLPVDKYGLVNLQETSCCDTLCTDQSMMSTR